MADTKGPPVEEECTGCEIPVCLKFVHATATDDFKLELKAIFENMCTSETEEVE